MDTARWTAGTSVTDMVVPAATPWTVDDLVRDIRTEDITPFVKKDLQHPTAIGCGTSGEVYRCFYEIEDPQNRLQIYRKNIVIKILVGAPDEKIIERIKREAATWRKLRHPNVSRFLGIAHVLPGRPPGLVSPYMQRNDLLVYIGRHPDLKREKALEIAAGLKYLHELKVIHGDLKADNIIISDAGAAQINDFGISQIMDVKGYTTKLMANVRFYAPELMPIEEVHYEVRPTFESDIFSLGILLLQLFHGPDRVVQNGLPYNHVRLRKDSIHELRLLRRIHEGERSIRERYTPMTDRHWELICKCWNGRPQERPDAAFVLNAL